jgi:hypothetical protein
MGGNMCDWKWSQPEINCLTKEKTWGGRTREEYLDWSVGTYYHTARALFKNEIREFSPGLSLRQQIDKFGEKVIGIWIEFKSDSIGKWGYMIPLDDSHLEKNCDE